MMIIEGTRFLGDFIKFIDAGSLSSIRIILIGVMMILVIRFRPQGIFPEERFRQP
jgi:branched-chain amino acid transport system permease protein